MCPSVILFLMNLCFKVKALDKKIPFLFNVYKTIYIPSLHIVWLVGGQLCVCVCVSVTNLHI